MRLLVVEDEKVLRKALVTGLKIKEYALDAASDGEQADVHGFKSSIYSLSFKTFSFAEFTPQISTLLYCTYIFLFSCYVQSGAMFSVPLFLVKYKLFEKNSQQKTAVYKTAVFTIIV